MADLKPSTAPAASALDGTELIPCTQAGDSKALTPDQIKTHTGVADKIGGSTGATDNAALRANGAGGKTAQTSLLVIDDAGHCILDDKVRVKPQSSGIFSLRNGDDSDWSVVNQGHARVFAGGAAVPVISLNPSTTTLGIVGLVAGGVVAFSSHASDATQAKDTGLERAAAGVSRFTDGGGTLAARWYQWAGESYLAADATNETATMAATGLSVTVKSGRKYGFKLLLFLSDSVAADGAKIDFGGGSATETNFRAQVTAFDAALALSAQLDDLTDVASIATFTGNGSIEVHGSFEPASDGTFAVRFAQAAHTAGTLTLYRGSHLLIWDMP